jgi:hypothetical protein
MYNALLHTHSGLRWIALLLLIITAFKSLGGYLGKKPYEPLDRKLSLFTTISFHTQFLLGLILLFISPNVSFDFSVSMHDKILRFFTMEHTIGMLLAIVLVTIGGAKAKRAQDDTTKHKQIAWFFIVALVLVLAMIPWPFMEKFATRSWF